MTTIKQRLKSCGIESLAVLERRHNTAAILIIVLVALVVVSITPQNAIGKEGGQHSADLNHLAVSASYKLYTFCIAPNGL